MSKLLFISQKVDLDDSVLSFTHSWINEFSKNFDEVSVICLFEGKHNLPENVKVYSLGKENGVSRLKYLYRFFKYIFVLRKSYDIVFVHMNQIYVILGGLIWKLLGKKIALSYVHRQTSLSLYLAEKLTDIIFTSSPESFQLKSKRVEYFGHGIDTTKFYFCPQDINFRGIIKIITVGRITPIKHLETIIEALGKLSENGVEARLTIIGSIVVESDKTYEKEVRQKVSDLGLEERVEFMGPINNNDLPKVYEGHDISINACPSGGLDKAVIESMSSGIITLTSNDAFRRYFGEYSSNLLFEFSNAESLADKIQKLKKSGQINQIRKYLRNVAVENFDEKNTIMRISERLKKYETGR